MSVVCKNIFTVLLQQGYYEELVLVPQVALDIRVLKSIFGSESLGEGDGVQGGLELTYVHALRG